MEQDNSNTASQSSVDNTTEEGSTQANVGDSTHQSVVSDFNLSNQQHLDEEAQPLDEHQNDNLPPEQYEEDNEQQPQAQEQGQGPINLEHSLLSLVDNISSSHLLSEDSIDALKELLCPKQPAIDGLSLKDPSIQDKIYTLIRSKSTSAHYAIGEALNYYHKMLVDSQIHQLDKLIRIIKSKKREMHLKRSHKAPKIIYMPSHILQENHASSHYTTQSDEGSHSAHTTTTNPQTAQQERAPELDIGQNPMEIMHLLDQNQLGAMILKKKVLPEYNPADKSIKFEVNDKYEVKLRICDDNVVVQKSKLDRIPAHLIQSHIFPYLASYELFALRAVCNEWRDLIRGMWHVIFKREMLEQIVAAELCNEIEMHFKLIQIRTPFYQKFGIFMKAIIEMIDWPQFNIALQNSETLDPRAKMLLITLFKFLGYDVSLDKLIDYEESHWNEITNSCIEGLKDIMEQTLQADYVFDSNESLERVRKDFIDASAISSHNIKEMDQKDYLMIFLYLRQLSVFGMLKNNLTISQRYAIAAKERLKEISKGWASKKGFLEGAYKILLFRFVKFDSGEIIVAKDDVDLDEKKMSSLGFNVGSESDTPSYEDASSHEEQKQDEQESMKDAAVGQHQLDELASKDFIVGKSTEEMDNLIIQNGLNFAGILPGQEKEASEQMNQQADSSNSQQNQEEASSKQQIESEVKGPEEHPLLQNSEFEEVKDFYSQDIEESLDKLIKTFFEKTKKQSEGSRPEPDYVIKKHGTETRVFLDDETRLEILIQKFLKFHILMARIKDLHRQHLLLKEQLEKAKAKEAELQAYSASHGKEGDKEQLTTAQTDLENPSCQSDVDHVVEKPRPSTR